MKPLYAAIDVGANAIKMKIVEYVDGEMRCLEDFSKAIPLGEDVYELGYINHLTVKEIKNILTYFKDMLTMYGVEKYRAIGTSSMREASNAKMVVEMLYNKTGIEIEIVEDTIEKFLTYKSMRDFVPDYRLVRKSAMIVEINSGSCDVSIYQNNHLVKNEEIKIGTKNIKNIINDLEERSLVYPQNLEELLETRTFHMWPEIKMKRIKRFMCLGGEAKQLKGALFGGKDTMPKEEFKSIYYQLIDYPRQLRNHIEDLGLDWYEFMISIIVYKLFFDLTQADDLMIPEMSLRDGVIADLIEEDFHLKRYQAFNNDIYSLARYVSKRYKSSESHLRHVEKNALLMFDALKVHYTLSDFDRRLLRLSSILHEIGKYTRLKDYLLTSYDKIVNLNILGVTQEELYIVGHVCRLISSSEIKPHDLTFEGVGDQYYGSIYKLTSIMSIADALDKGKRQKISIKQVIVDDDFMKIEFNYTGDITIEELSFDFASVNFTKTFGIEPVLVEIEE